MSQELRAELSAEMKAFAKRANAERKAQREAALAAMTPEMAEERIRIAAKILGDNDYLSAEYQLLLVADWLKAQQSKEAAHE